MACIDNDEIDTTLSCYLTLDEINECIDIPVTVIDLPNGVQWLIRGWSPVVKAGELVSATVEVVVRPKKWVKPNA